MYPSCRPGNQSNLSDSDKSHMKRGGLLNKHNCEKKSNISNETTERISNVKAWNLPKSHL